MTSFDTRHLHPYHGSDGLPKILHFVGECNALVDFCGCLHPGDICHFLSNTLRGRSLEKHFYVYESPEEELLGLVLLYPARYHGYDVLVHPHYRSSKLESMLIAWSEQQTQALLQETVSDPAWIGSDVMDCDTKRHDILQAQGYAPSDGPSLIYTSRSLLVMRTPGFHLDRELIVVAPDQRFAAFLIYWIDPVSKSGLFEPVGCHQNFQRRGLTRALMYEGMRRMVAHGMTKAIVNHQPAQQNPAAAALYRSVGFTLKYTITDYRKQIQ
jgi:ribosomal protein S18 acetylase RimI-like enzyme